jgi:hypothetical protein
MKVTVLQRAGEFFENIELTLVIEVDYDVHNNSYIYIYIK